jgi:hypothetical protein
MRFSINLLIVFVISNPVTAEASSMWCGPPNVDPSWWAEEALKNGDTVFIGRVLSVEAIPQPESGARESSNDAASMGELLEKIRTAQDPDFFDHIVSFKILKTWKDPLLPVVRSKVHLGLYASRAFAVGDDYLVIGRDIEGEVYWIRSLCGDAIHSQISAAYLDALDELTSAQ